MLSMEAYERADEERQLLLLLVKGDQEIAAGKGHDLDGVPHEADSILAADES